MFFCRGSFYDASRLECHPHKVRQKIHEQTQKTMPIDFEMAQTSRSECLTLPHSVSWIPGLELGESAVVSCVRLKKFWKVFCSSNTTSVFLQGPTCFGGSKHVPVSASCGKKRTQGPVKKRSLNPSTLDWFCLLPAHDCASWFAAGQALGVFLGQSSLHQRKGAEC